MSEHSNWLHHDHREYETVLENCQRAAEAEDWRTAKQLFGELASHLKTHIRMEEEILYPAYEEETGDRAAIEALRSEHEEIVRLLRDLSEVVRTDSSDHFLESLLPLRRAMGEHHRNEEEAFLPMAGHVLLSRREEIMRRLAEFEKTHGGGKRSWDF